VLKWVFVFLGIFVVLAGVVIWLANNGTVYISHEMGFTAFTGRNDAPDKATRDQFRKVIERLVPGDLFDMLWVSWTDDEYTGLMLTCDRGSPHLSITFKTHSEQAQLKSFKKAMAPLGYSVQENSDGFNGGMGEQHRVTSLEYPLPKSADAIIKAADTALANLHGSPPHAYFLRGSLFAHGPGAGPGITFSPAEDPLRSILGG
jgi:hypothetical protein